MYQKCPICEGKGYNSILNIYSLTQKCKTCNSKGIISKLTGLPPKEKINKLKN